MNRILPVLFAGLMVTVGLPAQAQEEVEALLTGQLFRADNPADSGTVVLHRVTPDEAGSIDSVSVDGEGRFSFRLPHLPVPGSGEVFFASSRYHGVLYYGTPVNEPVQLDSTYAIRVYPLERAPAGGVDLPVSLREIWIEEGPMGWEVTDAFIVRNDATVTFSVDAADSPVWSHPLPPGAHTLRVAEVGPVQGSVRLEDGVLVASNPLVPGENFFLVLYEVESIEMDLPLRGQTGWMQVLVREPAPAIRVEGLARQPPEQIEMGASVLRWAGQDLQDQTVRIRLGEESDRGIAVWGAVGLTLLLALGGILGVSRRRRPATIGLSRMRKEILIDLAQLDEAFAGIETPDAEARERYTQNRRRLMEELDRSGSDASR